MTLSMPLSISFRSIRFPKINHLTFSNICMVLVAQDPTGMLHCADLDFPMEHFRSFAFVLNNCNNQMSTDMFKQYLDLVFCYDPMGDFRSTVDKNGPLIVFENIKLLSDFLNLI